MNDEKHEGCLGLAIRAVMCVMAIIALTWLINGSGSSSLIALAG